jgi:hypothetical protein
LGEIALVAGPLHRQAPGTATGPQQSALASTEQHDCNSTESQHADAPLSAAVPVERDSLFAMIISFSISRD